jgi:putative transposase
MPSKSDARPDRHDLLTEIALFRYGLIAPLLHDPPGSGQQEAILRTIASKAYHIPGSTRSRVSVATLRRYLQTYRQDGFEGLRPGPRADTGQVKAFPPETLEKAIALREEQPARTTAMVVELLKRDPDLNLAQAPNVHTLTTHLRQRGKTRRLLAKVPQIYQRFERDQVNALWQGDAVVGPWLPDPEVPGRKKRAHLFGFIDDHSRLVPYAEWFWEEALPRLERVLKVAILRRGVPGAIYVDNGKVYVAQQFAAACATLGIRAIHATPYRPEGKGKIERWWSTLQTQFLPEVEVSHIATLEELNQSFWAWVECVYHRQVHSETQQTPLERYRAGLADVRQADPEQLRKAFLWREKRKVRKDATLSLQGNTYQVDLAYAGRTLELRFDPFDLARVDLYLEGRMLGTATVTTQGRQRHLAVETLALTSPTPPKPKSSLDYLAALRAEYQALLQKEAGTLSFARLLDTQSTQEH